MAAPTTILFGGGYSRRMGVDVARAAGVSPATITRWKRNPKMIPLGKLQILCRNLRLSDDEIIALVRSR